MAPLGGGGKEP